MLWSWINYFNPYARPTSPQSSDEKRSVRQGITELSIFKLISEILSYCNRQTVVIRQISAILPLLIHGPIRIFLQKFIPNNCLIVVSSQIN
jgi:hypothetical protein